MSTTNKVTNKRNNNASGTTDDKVARVTKKSKATLAAEAEANSGRFLAVFPDADVFKKIVEALKDFSDETDLQCSAGGIDTQFMDASHVTLCLMHLDRRDFQSYQHTRDIPIGVKFTVMLQRLAFYKIFGSCELTIDCLPNADKYQLTLTCKANPERRLISDMHQLHVDMEHMGVPDVVHEWEIDMSVVDYEIFVTAFKINDTVDITVTEQLLLISAENTDGQPIVFHLPASKPLEVEPTVKTEPIDEDVEESPQQEEEPENDRCDVDGADEESEEEEQEKPKRRKAAANKKKKVVVAQKKEPKVIKAGAQPLYIRHNTVGLPNGAACDKMKSRFALRYMSMYAKACEVSSNGRVQLILDPQQPILVKVNVLQHSSLQFYLAPKIDDSDTQ